MHVTLIHKYIYVYTYIHRVKSLFFCAHTLYILWMKESTFLIYITTHSLINNIWIHIFQNANFTRHEYMTFTKVLSWAQEMITYVTSKIKSKIFINIYIYTKAERLFLASCSLCFFVIPSFFLLSLTSMKHSYLPFLFCLSLVSISYTYSCCRYWRSWYYIDIIVLD